MRVKGAVRKGEGKGTEKKTREEVKQIIASLPLGRSAKYLLTVEKQGIF